jgi:hypothetical protein
MTSLIRTSKPTSPGASRPHSGRGAMGASDRRRDGCCCAGVRTSYCGSRHGPIGRLRGAVLAGCFLCADLAICLYLVLTAAAAYGFGGYVAGLLREPTTTTADADEVEFRDGMHGLLVWALATLLTAAFALGTAQSLTRLAAPEGGSAGPATSVGAKIL